jgi:hypothetical protein
METTYTGIDYGRRMANVDYSTGIRFGVIPVREVLQAWADEAQMTEEGGFVYTDDGYSLHQGVEEFDLWVLKSPYFTYAQFCSPCAPGACYLLNWLGQSSYNDNNKAYCLGHDWFENGVAPYPIYDVVTGKEIKAQEV